MVTGGANVEITETEAKKFPFWGEEITALQTLLYHNGETW